MVFYTRIISSGIKKSRPPFSSRLAAMAILSRPAPMAILSKASFRAGLPIVFIQRLSAAGFDFGQGGAAAILERSPNGLHVLQVVQAVDVDSAAAVVVLARQLSLAILELQALEVVGHTAVLASKDVVLPAILAAPVAAAVEAPVEPQEDVGRVQGLGAGQLLAAAAQLQLLQDPLWYGKLNSQGAMVLKSAGNLSTSAWCLVFQ